MKGRVVGGLEQDNGGHGQGLPCTQTLILGPTENRKWAPELDVVTVLTDVFKQALRACVYVYTGKQLDPCILSYF